ncbi:MAG: sensor histidine kinase [Acidobacteria bacterium]|nr:sensor histidine kinase [Acidobacteriota bacterium]
MSIRGRLLWLTIGLAVPLVLVGFFNLWEAWQASRAQLNQSIERQAELAATAFEQWIEAQTQTLRTVSTLAANDNKASLRDYLNSIIETRPHWLDVQIVDQTGKIELSQTVREKPLPIVSIESIRDEIKAKHSLVVISEQLSGQNLRLLSLAMPLADGRFILARIDGASASEVFHQLELPKEYIIAVFDPNYRLLYRSNVSPEQMSIDVSDTSLLSALGAKQTDTVEVESPYDKIKRIYGLARIEAVNCVVVVGVPSESLYAPAKAQYWRQLWIGSLIAVLAGALALLIARGIVLPMRELTSAARSFGHGDLSTRTDIRGSGPMREVAETFNQMAERIQLREEKLKELDNLKSEFVSSASHELRTPLTTIKALVRVLQSGNVSQAEREDYLKTIGDECDRQIEFVRNLLDLSRIESGAYKPNLGQLELSGFLQNLVDSLGRAANSRDLTLSLTLPDQTLPSVTTDADILRRVISSLIENSMKYTTAGGTVRVSAAAGQNSVSIAVEDSGCGIASEDLPYVFDKFYRGHPAPNGFAAAIDLDESVPPPDSGGMGLGLFLSRSLAEQIGAEITVESPIANGTGSRFTFTMPA